MGNLAIKTETISGSDQSWIVKPNDITEVGCTIDIAKLPADVQAAGRVPSGFALGKVTTTGRFGAYDVNDGAAVTDGRAKFAGLVFDDVKFKAGATTGVVTASRVVIGAVYAAKLPLADEDAGDPGRLDATGQLDLPTIVLI